MKKVFILLVFSFLSFFAVAQSTDKVDKVLTGVGNEVSAIHTDTKDAISTLHQDATKVVETVYTDSKSVIGTLYEDVNEIVKYATPKLEAGLVALAQTLKTTVNEVFKALVMKQIAISVSYAFAGLFAFILLYFSYRIISMPDEKLLNPYPNFNGAINWKLKWILSLIVTSVSSLSLFVVFISNFQTMAIGFIAPKAAAMLELVNIVNTLIR